MMDSLANSIRLPRIDRHENSDVLVVPKSPEVIKVPASSREYLRDIISLRKESSRVGMVVLGLRREEGLLAFGPESRCHVHILHEAAIQEGVWHYVTSSHDLITRVFDDGSVRGERFKITRVDPPEVVVHDTSHSFGGFEEHVFGMPLREFVRERIQREISML
jgi:hypothetical protein